MTMPTSRIAGTAQERCLLLLVWPGGTCLMSPGVLPGLQVHLVSIPGQAQLERGLVALQQLRTSVRSPDTSFAAAPLEQRGR